MQVPAEPAAENQDEQHELPHSQPQTRPSRSELARLAGRDARSVGASRMCGSRTKWILHHAPIPTDRDIVQPIDLQAETNRNVRRWHGSTNTSAPRGASKICSRESQGRLAAAASDDCRWRRV